MATTQISDIVDVTVFQDLPAVNSVEKTAFYESGIIVRSPLLDQRADTPGAVTVLPFWKDLDTTGEPNYSTDDPTDIAVPDKIEQGEQGARTAYLNNGWSTSDLATELAMGENAMSRIRNRTDRYWQIQNQKRLLSTAKGVLADNLANDNGDMVVDIFTEDGDNAASTNLYSRSAFVQACFTMGDMFDGITAIAVHSVIYARMVDNDDIEFVKDSAGNLTIPTYLGKRVILDDSMPVRPGTTSGFVYTSILFGPGMFGFGDGSPTVPVAIERNEDQGEGGGIETLWVRKTWLTHPFGFKIEGAPAGKSFTLAELEAAVRWDRVIARKNIPMAFLRSNG